MLSEKEKIEMLLDARSKERARAFRKGRLTLDRPVSFDEYLTFLNQVQEIFGPFQVSQNRTETSRNKL